MSTLSALASATNSAAQQAREKPETTRTGNPANAAALKQQLNVRILEASAKVSLTAGNQPQALVFRSAIDRINELLGPELRGPEPGAGAGALPEVAAQDNSAEATSGRILSISTGFYESYAKQHAGEDPEAIAKNFVSLIRGGFEKGFGEARNILEGMNVFNGEVQSGVMKTYDLVQKGYDDFLNEKLAALQPKETDA
ncbi:MAG: DUF5610 domain-containing protein [Candidatus Accumulibacter sp.]|jgi:hypothetical protein|nr:DUF5610 domain-containing protein [Accumulibacter sp.]